MQNIKTQKIQIRTKQVPVHTISVINITNRYAKTEPSIEHSSNPTDATSRRYASSGRTVATVKVNSKQIKISKIEIRNTKAETCQKCRAKFGSGKVIKQETASRWRLQPLLIEINAVSFNGTYKLYSF
jgi:hypothetical protein